MLWELMQRTPNNFSAHIKREISWIKFSKDIIIEKQELEEDLHLIIIL